MTFYGLSVREGPYFSKFAGNFFALFEPDNATIEPLSLKRVRKLSGTPAYSVSLLGPFVRDVGTGVGDFVFGS